MPTIVSLTTKDGTHNRWKVLHRPVENGYQGYCYVMDAPTGDAEIASIYAFNGVLGVYENTETILISMMKEIAKGSGKHLFLFDIEKCWEKKVDYLKPIFKKDYVSSNASNMILGIIDTDTLNIPYETTI
jgi:hypothetical protein